MTFRTRLRHPFEERLVSIRKKIQPEPFGWYPFDSLANITHLEALLPNGLDSLVELAGGEPVADIGTGDGDMAFLLESLGCNVTAIDWPGTNANEMNGLALLRRELGSSIAIREVEIDQQFQLDGERFGLVMALGLLYHLKNPYYFLEKLGAHARYGLFSTCILSADRTNEAVAYLASEREFHDDATNFWFFSETGILRLLDRCGWDVQTTKIIRDGKDDRFFCLGESRLAKTKPTIRLLEGWHAPENRAWRWTGREFGVVIENMAGARRLEFRFEVMPALLELRNALAVDAVVNGIQAPAATFRVTGKHVYSQAFVPAPRRCEIRIRLSHTFPESYPAPADGDRDLGVIVRLPHSTIIDDDCGLRLV